MSELIGIADAARLAQCSTNKVYLEVARGTLRPALEIGSRMFFSRTEIARVTPLLKRDRRCRPDLAIPA